MNIAGLTVAVLLGLGIATFGYAETKPESQGLNTPEFGINKNNTLQVFEDYFQDRLGKELAALGVDQNALDAQRKSIRGEQDQKYALMLATEFNTKYRPLYISALQNMKISEGIIADLLIDASTPNIDDNLDIIRVSYRCSGLALELCNAVYPGACEYQAFGRGDFSYPGPISQHTDRYTLESHADGVLNMWKHNIDGDLTGEVGATWLTRANTHTCVQTRGHLESFSVSTSLDIYLNALAESGAFLQLYVGPYATDPLTLRRRFIGFGIDRSNLDVALGDEYGAWRLETAGLLQAEYVRIPDYGDDFWGFHSLNLGGPTHNGLTNSNLPYLIEDQVWVSSQNAGAMKAYYEGDLGQRYRWGDADGRLRFVLDEIDVLLVPN